MTAPDPVRAYLAGLPQPRLPPGLWPRLQAAHLRQRRRRLVGRLSLAVAAMLVLVAAPLLYVRLAPPPSAPVTARLEAPAVDLPSPSALAELRAIDRALQDAYYAGADEDDVQMLWRAREQAVARMAASPAPEPIRI